MADRILRGWKEIESVTPWANSPGLLIKRDGKWLRDNGYVIKSVIGKRPVAWTWESVIKAGIIALMKRKAEIREAVRARKTGNDIPFIP